MEKNRVIPNVPKSERSKVDVGFDMTFINGLITGVIIMALIALIFS